jgi:uncharacterized protein (TIGR02117 family)
MITVNNSDAGMENTETIYLSSNGVHLDIIVKKSKLSVDLMNGLQYDSSDNYFAFGWGDENFYLKTPYWSDMTIGNAFKATFLKGPSLIHLTRYRAIQTNWLEVKISISELQKINELLLDAFITDANGHKMLLKDAGYTMDDDFYKAKGSYSFHTTCNTWVNTIFKKSGLKACLWTPFDFGLMAIYR